MIIFYNPECSKCNKALGLLNESNCEVEIRNYLLNPPTDEEIRNLLELLGCRAEDIVRKKEPLYIELFDGKTIDESEWPGILSKHPILIERPIVVHGDKAIIGRPPEKVLEIITRL